MSKQLSKTQETKLMIIENFIDYFSSNEVERLKMKMSAFDYVDEDHVDEIEQAGFVIGNHKMPMISSIDVEIEKSKSEESGITATSVEEGLKVYLTIEQKDKAVDDDLIFFDAFNWKFFDADLKRLIKTVLKQKTKNGQT